MNRGKNLCNRNKLVLHLLLAGFCLICTLPLVLVLSVSFSSDMDILRNGYSMIPREINLDAYRVIFARPQQIINSYKITALVTLVGTLMGMTISSMLAYAISRKDYAYARRTSLFILIPLIFNVILVPWYILISRMLMLKNSFWVLVIPYLVVPWFVILMKGFLSTVPISVIHSAKIDGANEYRVFFSIVLPMSKAGLATVSLFYALMYWNDYRMSLFFMEHTRYLTLQFLLFRIMSNLDFLNSALAAQSGMVAGTRDIPSLSARMAMCILAAGPMLFVFPFFQKYFVRGMTIGAVKG